VNKEPKSNPQSNPSSDAAIAKHAGASRPAHSRRAFLKGLGAASATIPLTAIVAHAAERTRLPDVLSNTRSDEVDLNGRPHEAYERRLNAAKEDRKVQLGDQSNNGDEALYPSGIANYTKGFAHNSFGEVDLNVYGSYLAAVRTGKRADFDSLPMGGTEPLVDPQSGLAFDLETVDVSQNSIPPFDTLNSPGLAAQMIEAYWMALTRDVQFSNYATDPSIAAAAAELSSLSSYTGPKIGGSVTPQALFRGFTAPELIGPYISQFFLQPFSIGPMPSSGYMTTLPGDFGTDPASWLNIQNGAPAPLQKSNPDPQVRLPPHRARSSGVRPQ